MSCFAEQRGETQHLTSSQTPLCESVQPLPVLRWIAALQGSASIFTLITDVFGWLCSAVRNLDLCQKIHLGNPDSS